MRPEISNPEFWKSEFRYSEIAIFVLAHLYISMGILVKALPHLRCIAAFTNILIEIMIQYVQKGIPKVISTRRTGDGFHPGLFTEGMGLSHKPTKTGLCDSPVVQFEKENINTMDSKGEVLLNIKWGLQYRCQNGEVQVNHNRFLGYTKDEEGHLIIDPTGAEVVKRIYREYLEGGSLIQIARGLEADGMFTAAGKSKWRPETRNYAGVGRDDPAGEPP